MAIGAELVPGIRVPCSWQIAKRKAIPKSGWFVGFFEFIEFVWSIVRLAGPAGRVDPVPRLTNNH